MKIKINGLKRVLFASAALVVGAVAALPSLSGTAFAAYNQPTNRYVMMDNSKGAATGVSYEVGFTLATTGNVQGVVVDFCTSPIIGTACTKPSGFSVGTPTVATTGGNNTGLGAGWTAASNNTNRTLSITNGSGGSISSGTNIKFTLSTATNPTADDTAFYARVFTFPTTANVTTWLSTTDGSATANAVDAGGVAMSTASQISLTAKVQEQISFCVFKTSCGTAPSVNLGDTNGILSSSGPYVDADTTYTISTNASSGAMVRLKGALPTSGVNTLTSIGTTATASSAGTTQFGLCTWQSAGSGLTPQAPYNHASCNTTTTTAGTGSTGGNGSAQFAFDTTPAASSYGDDLALKAAGASSTGKIAFIGNIAVTQPAGVYLSTYTLIATGTY